MKRSLSRLLALLLTLLTAAACAEEATPSDLPSAPALSILSSQINEDGLLAVTLEADAPVLVRLAWYPACMLKETPPVYETELAACGVAEAVLPLCVPGDYVLLIYSVPRSMLLARSSVLHLPAPEEETADADPAGEETATAEEPAELSTVPSPAPSSAGESSPVATASVSSTDIHEVTTTSIDDSTSTEGSSSTFSSEETEAAASSAGKKSKKTSGGGGSKRASASAGNKGKETVIVYTPLAAGETFHRLAPGMTAAQAAEQLSLALAEEAFSWTRLDQLLTEEELAALAALTPGEQLTAVLALLCPEAVEDTLLTESSTAAVSIIEKRLASQTRSERNARQEIMEKFFSAYDSEGEETTPIIGLTRNAQGKTIYEGLVFQRGGEGWLLSLLLVGSRE